MNKSVVLESLKKYQSELIDHLNKSVGATFSATDMDETDTIDMEDLSHQSEDTFLKQNLEVQLSHAERDMVKLNTIALDEKDHAMLGALVKTNHDVFFISIAAHPLDINNTHFVFLSEESPLYHEMRNKKVGDTFSFANKNYTITGIE